MWLVGVPAGVDNLPALRVGVWHGDHQEEGGGVGVADTGVVACTQCAPQSSLIVTLTCVLQLHPGQVQSHATDRGELLRVEDCAGPLVGRDDLVASLPVERHGRRGEALQPALQADALPHRVVVYGATRH